MPKIKLKTDININKNDNTNIKSYVKDLRTADKKKKDLEDYKKSQRFGKAVQNIAAQTALDQLDYTTKGVGLTKPKTFNVGTKINAAVDTYDINDYNNKYLGAVSTGLNTLKVPLPVAGDAIVNTVQEGMKYYDEQNPSKLNQIKNLPQDVQDKIINAPFGYVESFKNGGMIKRADGSYSKRGLWDNIRANKGSGKAPTKEMLKQERKIKAKYPDGGTINNPGFKALPENIQKKILAKMAMGGKVGYNEYVPEFVSKEPSMPRFSKGGIKPGKWSGTDASGNAIKTNFANSTTAGNIGTGAGIAASAVPMLTSFIPDDKVTDSEGNEIGSETSLGKGALEGAAKGAQVTAMLGGADFGASIAIGAGIGAIHANMGNEDLKRERDQANMKIKNRGMSNSVLTNKNMFSTNVNNNDQMIAANGGTVIDEDMGNPNAELELNETFRDPMTGEVGMVDGPSHDEGGIEMSLAEGTQIWSDRLKHNGRTFASLTKPIINKIATLEKGTKDNPNSRFKQNSIKLLNSQLDFFFDKQESGKQQDEMKRTLKKQEGGVVDDMGNYHFASGGIYINPKNNNSAPTDSTAYYKDEAKFQSDLAVANAKYGNRKAAEENMAKSRKAYSDASRQQFKGKPGFDSMGIPKKSLGGYMYGNGGMMKYAEGGKLPKNILQSRLESHMSPKEADNYISQYGMGGYAMYGQGGTNNPGFNALPKEVQNKILSKMSMGGMMQYDEGGTKQNILQTSVKNPNSPYRFALRDPRMLKFDPAMSNYKANQNADLAKVNNTLGIQMNQMNAANKTVSNIDPNAALKRSIKPYYNNADNNYNAMPPVEKQTEEAFKGTMPINMNALRRGQSDYENSFNGMRNAQEEYENLLKLRAAQGEYENQPFTPDIVETANRPVDQPAGNNYNPYSNAGIYSAIANYFAQNRNLKYAAPEKLNDVYLQGNVGNPRYVDLSAERGAINRSAMGAMGEAQRGFGNSAAAQAFKNKARINQLEQAGKSYLNQENINAGISNEFLDKRFRAGMAEAEINNRNAQTNLENAYGDRASKAAARNANLSLLSGSIGDVFANKSKYQNDLERERIISNRYEKKVWNSTQDNTTEENNSTLKAKQEPLKTETAKTEEVKPETAKTKETTTATTATTANKPKTKPVVKPFVKKPTAAPLLGTDISRRLGARTIKPKPKVNRK